MSSIIEQGAAYVRSHKLLVIVSSIVVIITAIVLIIVFTSGVVSTQRSASSELSVQSSTTTTTQIPIPIVTGGGTPGTDPGSGWGGGGGGGSAYIPDVTLTTLNLNYNAVAIDLLQDPYNAEAPTYVVHVGYITDIDDYAVEIAVGGANAVITENDEPIGSQASATVERATWIERTFVVTDGSLSATYTVTIFFSGTLKNGTGSPVWQAFDIPNNVSNVATINITVDRDVTLTGVNTGVWAFGMMLDSRIVIASDTDPLISFTFNNAGHDSLANEAFFMYTRDVGSISLPAGSHTITVTYLQNDGSPMNETYTLAYRAAPNSTQLFTSVNVE